MDKTKLDPNNRHHQLLIATFANFVSDYGYTTRELFLLMNDSQNKLFSALREMEQNRSDNVEDYDHEKK